MRKLVILHFHPVEIYPPVMNLVNFLGDLQTADFAVEVHTLRGESSTVFNSPSTAIKIRRYGKVNKQQSAIRRYFNYASFNLSAIFRLLTWRPDVILVYETISFLPAAVYKRLFPSKTRLMIHYHEYVSPEEYHSGMRLTKWLHDMEKKLYPELSWISHTNAQRMERFLRDHREIRIHNEHILPNYPPSNWKRLARQSNKMGDNIKVVYVGALSMETMYTREFAEWILNSGGKMIWHIYSDNITGDAKEFIDTCDQELISFKGAVNYYGLPAVLAQYHVGVILYKGHIPNYVYNAPNKLFEYLACGLDVWLPVNMESSLPYARASGSPKVLPLDFTRLASLDVAELTDHTDHPSTPTEYYYENVLDELVNTMHAGN